MRQSFTVSAHVAPGLPVPPVVKMCAYLAAVSAVRDYVAVYMPGYQLIPGGRIDAPNLWRFEAINHGAQLGAVLWARTIENQ